MSRFIDSLRRRLAAGMYRVAARVNVEAPDEGGGSVASSAEPTIYEFRPELLAKFLEPFAAVLALDEWVTGHRPTAPPSQGAAGELILRTYARSSKTYRASIILAGLGYGAQAGMLNRSLFEDMAVSHWIKLNPDHAPALYERHRQHTMTQMKDTYKKYDREVELASWPPLGDAERQELATEFARKHHWTKRSLYELVKDIEGEFTDEHVDRRMLWQMFDISHRFNNLILHHSFFGLGLAAKTEAGRVQHDVGPSDRHVFGALQGAFFSYGHTTSLVHTGVELAELNALWSEHIGAFSSTKLVPRDRPNGHDRSC